jgi:hypothetical protein
MKTVFKLQHPADLISRLFILEYMRELTPEKLYEKANPIQKKNLFYKYVGENEEELIDINWEYCLFEALFTELEGLMKNFLPEIEEIESLRNNTVYKKAVDTHIKEEISKSVSINLMDIAKADINKNDRRLL